MAEEADALVDAELPRQVGTQDAERGWIAAEEQGRSVPSDQPSSSHRQQGEGTMTGPTTEARAAQDLSPSASGPGTAGSVPSPPAAVTAYVSPPASGPASGPGTVELSPQSPLGLEEADESSPPAKANDAVDATPLSATKAHIVAADGEQAAPTAEPTHVAPAAGAVIDADADVTSSAPQALAEQDLTSVEVPSASEIAALDAPENSVAIPAQEKGETIAQPTESVLDDTRIDVPVLPDQVQVEEAVEERPEARLPEAQDAAVDGPSDAEPAENVATQEAQTESMGVSSQLLPSSERDDAAATTQMVPTPERVSEENLPSQVAEGGAASAQASAEVPATAVASSTTPHATSPATLAAAANETKAGALGQVEVHAGDAASAVSGRTTSAQPAATEREIAPAQQAAVDRETTPTQPVAADSDTASTKPAATEGETASTQQVASTIHSDILMEDVSAAAAAAPAVEAPKEQQPTTSAPVALPNERGSGSGETSAAAQAEQVDVLPITSDASPTLPVPGAPATEMPVTTAQPPAASTTTSAASSPQSDTLITGQIALLLKINKELIRLCVDLQAKEMTGDVIYKTSAMRLQANLGFLAGLTESASGKPSGAVLNDEPFPVTMHAPDSLLPKLYAHLRSLNTPTESPTAAGKKRRRGEHDASPVRAAPSRAGSIGAKTATTPAATAATKPKAGNSRRKSSAAGTASAGSPVVPAFGLAGSAAAPSPSPSMANGFIAANGPPRSTASPAPNAASAAGSPPQQPNGVRPSGPTQQQLQGLIQAFGQNAVTNLNSLQAHYRGGQQQALVGYMEANVANFRNLPLQMQLQHMASVQNAALQRQRQASVGSASSPNASGVQAQSQPPQPRPTPPSRRTSAAPSPAGASAAAEHMRRSTQSPMAAPATPFQSAAAAQQQMQQQQQQHHTSNTPVMMPMPFAANNMASPASSATAPSPGVFQQQQQQHYQNVMQQQQAQQLQQMSNPYAFAGQQQQPLSTSQAQQLMTSLPASLSGLPAHLQQQFVQHLMLQQQQQQLTGQPMGAPDMSGAINPMMAAMMQQQSQQQQGGSPANMFRGVASQAAGGPGAPPQGGGPNLANMWAAMQQQQSPPPPSSSS